MLQIKYVPGKYMNIKYIIYGAAKGKYIKIFKWLNNNGYKIDKNDVNISHYVVKGNHFNFLKQLYNNGYNINNTTTANAIFCFKSDIISRLLIEKNVVSKDELKKNPTISSPTGNIDMVQWLIETNDYYDDLCVKNAVRKNRLDIIEIIHKKCDGSSNLYRKCMIGYAYY